MLDWEKDGSITYTIGQHKFGPAVRRPSLLVRVSDLVADHILQRDLFHIVLAHPQVHIHRQYMRQAQTWKEHEFDRTWRQLGARDRLGHHGERFCRRINKWFVFYPPMTITHLCLFEQINIPQKWITT